MTKVIHIKNAPKNWTADPKYMYIGRAGQGFAGEWGNPFTVQQYGQGEACRQHLLWLRGEAHHDVEPERRQWILDHLHLLDGTVMVCFCKSTPEKSCHGDNYILLLNERKAAS